MLKKVFGPLDFTCDLALTQSHIWATIDKTGYLLELSYLMYCAMGAKVELLQGLKLTNFHGQVCASYL